MWGILPHDAWGDLILGGHHLRNRMPLKLQIMDLPGSPDAVILRTFGSG